MRVISGSVKGFTLKAVKGMATRPTADRVKESLFNILTINQQVVLDLFAGTGNLGIEALSRGAERAIFVDKSSASISVIRDNLLHTRLHGQAEIYQRDVFQFITSCRQKGRLFDLIFCDPPYQRGLSVKAVEAVSQSEILRFCGLMVVEHSVRDQLADGYRDLVRVRSKQYGDTMITMYTRKSKEDPHSADSDMSGQF